MQPLHAIETTGALDEHGRLHLDAPLSGTPPGPVRILLLAPADDEIEETGWLRVASRSPAFDFLRDPAEDLYTAEDGVPFDAEPT